MDKNCVSVFTKLSIDEHIRLLSGQVFIKIIFNPNNKKLYHEIKNVCEEYLGDWYESIQHYKFSGAIVFYQCGFTHEILDYENSDKIIHVSLNSFEK